MTNPDQNSEKNSGFGSDYTPQHSSEDGFGSFGNSGFGQSAFGSEVSDAGSHAADSASNAADAASTAASNASESDFGTESTQPQGSDSFGSDFNQGSFGQSDLGSQPTQDFGQAQGFGQSAPQAQPEFQQEYQQASYSQPEQGFGQQHQQQGFNNQQGFGQQPQDYGQQGFSQQPQGFQQPVAAPYPQQGGYPQGFQQPQQKSDSFFKSLFDFKFENFVTVKFASIIYIIAIVVGVLQWLGGLLWAILVSFAGSIAYDLTGGSGGLGVLLFLGYLIFGTIGFFIYVICVRVALEALVANIKTAENTRDILAEEKASK